ncbi:MAG: TRAP transporter large permease subunit, partial [Gammaproteobacteria bacterium]|nr:TRAP transporter large permease subunit [Gammaproteobacteria bacterium]
PALINFGLDPISSHLFILYWGMLSYITPPVALAAVAASVIARSGQMETAFMAMRLGSIKFILPFIIVVTPALIIRGEPLEVVLTISACTIAVILMAIGFEGHLYWVGRIAWPTRAALLVAAAGFLYPDMTTYAISAVATLVIFGIAKMRGPKPPVLA